MHVNSSTRWISNSHAHGITPFYFSIFVSDLLKCFFSGLDNGRVCVVVYVWSLQFERNRDKPWLMCQCVELHVQVRSSTEQNRAEQSTIKAPWAEKVSSAFPALWKNYVHVCTVETFFLLFNELLVNAYNHYKFDETHNQISNPETYAIITTDLKLLKKISTLSLLLLLVFVGLF